jgi:hypothetical protein
MNKRAQGAFVEPEAGRVIETPQPGATRSANALFVERIGV